MITLRKDAPVLAYLHMVAGLEPYLEGYSRPANSDGDREKLKAMLERHENNIVYFRNHRDEHGDGDQEMELVLDHLHTRIELKCGHDSGSLVRLIFKREAEHDEWDRARVLISAVEYRHNRHAYDMRIIIPHALPETVISALQDQMLGSIITAQTGQAGAPNKLLQDGTADISAGYLPPSFNAVLAMLAAWKVKRAEERGHTLLILGHPEEC